MKKIFVGLVLALLLCGQAAAESSVWKVDKGGNVFYLGGTFHMLRQADFPLPAEYEKAYRASSVIVFETDIGQMNDAATQQKMMSQALYADGSTIDKYLSPKTYNLLDKYCTDLGVPLAAIKQYKPSFIAIMMVTVELSKFGVLPEGVDTFYYQSAKNDHKAVEGLESVAEQIDFVVGMGEGNEDEFIINALKDIDSIEKDYGEMVDAWKHGDVKELEKLIIKDLKSNLPQLYKNLIANRNENWLPKIEAYHKTAAPEFILVGAAHLVGPDGIIESLRRKGYTVQKL